MSDNRLSYQTVFSNEFIPTFLIVFGKITEEIESHPTNSFSTVSTVPAAISTSLILPAMPESVSFEPINCSKVTDPL